MVNVTSSVTTRPSSVRSATSNSDGKRFAFVTLVTTDSYLPGALVLAHSLRQAHSTTNKPRGALTPADLANLGEAGLSNKVSSKKVDLVCLVTPGTVNVRTTKTLLRFFDKVVGVEPLSFSSLAAAKIKGGQSHEKQHQQRPFYSKQELRDARRVRNETRKKLALLGRPDLGESAGAALTKLHAWRLTGYDKIVYLDADILVLRPIAHLFSVSSNLAASPDIGWPDAFNTGLLVLTPSLTTFSSLREYAVQRGSWDGADQGLLNDFFGGEQGGEDVGPGGGWQRLPFRYNVTPNAGYMFAPAYQRYGAGIMTAHFIGPHKPWNRPKPNTPSTLGSNNIPTDHETLLYLWHSAFEQCYPNAARWRNESGLADVIHTERGVSVVERTFSVPSYKAVWDLEGEAHSSLSGEQTIGKRGSTSKLRRQRAPSASSLFRGAGQAEDLKEMFTPSIVAASAAAEMEMLARAAEGKPNEGVYVSLPLDARTSLMAAQLDSGDEEEASTDSEETVRRSSDLSGTPRPSNDDHTWSNVSQTTAQTSQSGEWSPPKVSWDPAKGPPPKTGGASEYQMRSPIDNFYVNAWDQPIASQPRGKQAFFGSSSTARSPSQQRTIERLQREHFFDNLGSDRPDARKVKPVFPWEAGVPASSSRIFPDDEPSSVVPGSHSMTNSLAAGSQVTPEAHSSAGDDTSPERGHQTRGIVYDEVTRAGGGLPERIAYTNAWDQVESIGRYARRAMPSSQRNNQGVQAQAERAHRSTQTASGGSNARSAGGFTSSGAGSGSGMTNANVRAGGGGGGGENGGHDVSADQSGDGDNESSSSSDDEEIVGRGGASWRREGPGPGYQRKAESHHQHQHQLSGGSASTLRSPRHNHQALANAPRQSGQRELSSGGGAMGDLIHQHYYNPASMSDLRGRLSRSSSSASDGYGHHGAVPTPFSTVDERSSSHALDHDAMHRHYDTPLSLPYEQLLASYGSASRRRMGMPRTPTASRPASANNSGASSPTMINAGGATPVNLSPNQSRSDLATMVRLASAQSNVSNGQGNPVRNGTRTYRRMYRRTYDA